MTAPHARYSSCVPTGMPPAAELAASIREQLAEQGRPTSAEDAARMAEGILGHRATHPDGRCTETCGCISLEGILAKYGDGL